jgi:hypothetical protein
MSFGLIRDISLRSSDRPWPGRGATTPEDGCNRVVSSSSLFSVRNPDWHSLTYSPVHSDDPSQSDRLARPWTTAARFSSGYKRGGCNQRFIPARIVMAGPSPGHPRLPGLGDLGGQDVDARNKSRQRVLTVVLLLSSIDPALSRSFNRTAVGLVPGIHGNRQGVCRGSRMAGPSPATTIEGIVSLRLSTRCGLAFADIQHGRFANCRSPKPRSSARKKPTRAHNESASTS